jgi:hypothetical protein
MCSPIEPAVEPYGAVDVHLSIDEATVLLGLLDLLQPAPSSDSTLRTLVQRTRGRLAAAISESITSSPSAHGGGLRSV